MGDSRTYYYFSNIRVHPRFSDPKFQSDKKNNLPLSDEYTDKIYVIAKVFVL